LLKWIKPYKEEFNKKQWKEDPFKDFTVELFTFATIQEDVLSYLLTDSTLIIVAFIFVGCYFRGHLGSWFLSGAGLSIIFLSFPATAVIANGICRVTYFSTL